MNALFMYVRRPSEPRCTALRCASAIAQPQKKIGPGGRVRRAGGLLGQAVLVGDHPLGAGRQQRRDGGSGRAAAPAQRPGGPIPGGSGSRSARRRYGNGGQARPRGQRPQLGPASRQRRQSGYVVERRHSLSWGRQCSSTTTRSGAERQRQRNNGGGEAAVQARGQQLWISQAKRQRRQSGCAVERRHSPSWGRQCSSTEERRGRRAAAPAQRPGGPNPGAAAPAQPGEETATTVGVRGRTETLPLLGQAVLVDGHPQWGVAAAEERRERQEAAPAQRPGGPSPGGRLLLSPRRDSDDSRGTLSKGDTPVLGQAVLVDGHPQWGGAEAAEERRERQEAAPAQRPGGPCPGAAALRLAQPGDETATTVGVRGRRETLPVLKQAVLVDGHLQWSGGAAAGKRLRY